MYADPTEVTKFLLDKSQIQVTEGPHGKRTFLVINRLISDHHRFVEKARGEQVMISPLLLCSG
jgi:hypothetical protein